MSPLIVVGVLALGAWALKGSKPAQARTTADALIDPSEVMAPNAPAVRSIILQTMQGNSLQAYENAAVFATTAGMPKTAANIRAWKSMVQAGGNAVAGDEVGAVRLRVREQLPDWLKFQATQGKLAGDPHFIRATAETMKRFGYRHAAEIHLKTAAALER
jgi:hypothetical protein